MVRLSELLKISKVNQDWIRRFFPVLKSFWSKIKELFLRFSFGITYVVVVVGSLALGRVYLVVLLGLFAVVAVYELQDMLLSDGVPFYSRGVGVIFALVSGLVGILRPVLGASMAFVGYALFVFIHGVLLKRDISFVGVKSGEEPSTENLRMALKMNLFFPLVVYFSVGMHCILWFYDQFGFWRTIGVFVLVWVFDVFSYLGGKTWGSHRLTPAVSEGKTWEGFITGWLALVLASVGLWLVGLIPSPWEVGAISFILAPVLLGGDLVESIAKRVAGVKDSGAIIPGHGGIWDRLDSTITAFYFMYVIYQLGVMLGV